MWGVKNFMPQLPEGEDERTQELYIQKIKYAFKQHPYNRKHTIINAAIEKNFFFTQKNDRRT